MRLSRITVASAAGAAALILIASLTLSAMAAPHAQDTIATPSPFPIDDVQFTLDTVGGPDWATQSVTFESPEGVTIGETVVESAPPDGVTVRAPISLATGTIDEVSLLVRYPFGFRERRQASHDDAAGDWVAALGTDSGSLPIWARFDIAWQVVDADGTRHETAWQPAVYADPEREWWHSENEYLEQFWLDIPDIEPDRVAESIAQQAAANAPLRQAGYGSSLDVKPRRVIVPDHDTWAALDGRELEFLESLNGMQYDRQAVSIRVLFARTTELVVNIYDDCALLQDLPAHTRESADVGALLADINEDTRRMLARHHQHAVIGDGDVGPNWWSHGQADYLAQMRPLYDIEDRLSRLAALQTLPPLSAGDITVEVAQADACPFLGYDVGWSFVNWFVGNYGLEAHAEVVALMADDTALVDAIEHVTELTFFDVENQWRAYIGFEEVTLADVDPTAALEAYEDDRFAAGDTVTLPAAPPIVNLHVDPGPGAVARGTCFAGTPVEILRIGAVDDIPYYEIDCMGLTGWVTRDVLVG